MPNQQPAINELFRALADPTRLAVVERLSKGNKSASELAARFDMSLPSFTQHLNILENCGLITSEKSGRVRTYVLQTKPLATAQHWLDRQRQHWTQRMNQLDEFLLATKDTAK